MHRLLGIVRHAAGMTAVVSSDEGLDEHVSQRVVHPCVSGQVPLSRLPEAIWPARDKDDRAWRSLGRVPGLGHRAALAVIRVMMGSVTEHLTAPTEPLRFGRGPADLRPYLCNPEGESQIIAAIGPVIQEVSANAELPTWHWTHRHEIAALPAGFRTHFLWSLHLHPWPLVGAMAAAYEALGLAQDLPLRDVCARFAGLVPIETALETFDRILDESPVDRLHVLRVALSPRD